MARGPIARGSLESQTGDTLLMVAGRPAKVRPTMGELRLQLGDKFGLRAADELRFLWVVEFPVVRT